MTNRAASLPRLYALIADIAKQVPYDIAREIECALEEQNLPLQAPTFFACLDAIRRAEGANGQPCNPCRLGASDHASLSRSLAGLSALLDLLQAAERARVEGGPDEQMGSFHTDGLIVAARQLVCEATHCLERGTP